MSVLGFWGFNSGDRPPELHGWGHVWNAWVCYVTADMSGFDGPYSVYCTQPSGAYVQVPGSYSLPTAYLGFHLKYTGSPGTYARKMLYFLNASSQIMATLYQGGGDLYLRAYRGDGATLLGTSTNTFATNTRHAVRVEYTPHDTNGTFKVWVGDTLEINVTGVDTADGTVGNVTQIRIGSTSNFASAPFYFSSVVLDDAQVPGAKWHVGRKLPNGAGYATNMTALGGGANWSEVDEVPRDPSKGVYDNVASELDAYTLAALTGQIDTIQAVKAMAQMVKQGECTPANMRLGIRSSSTNYLGSDEALAYTLKQAEKLWLTDPADSQPWSVSKVDALQALIETRT